MPFEIIVPGRFLEPKDPVKFKSRYEGIFTLRAVKRGGIIRERVFKNLIVNDGLDSIGVNTAGLNLYRFAGAGTGTSPPSVTDTDLDNRIGSWIAGTSVSGQFNGGAPDWYTGINLNWRSPVGHFGNNNLTEIGISGNLLFSRALILDSLGNPTTFPILEDEALDITYQLRVYPPLEDALGTVTIAGNSHDYLARAVGVNSTSQGSGWYLGGMTQGFSLSNFSGFPGNANQLFTGDAVENTSTSRPSGAIGSSNASVSNNSYVGGSYKKSGRFSWGTAANSNNIRTHAFIAGPGNFQVQYDPPLAKTNIQTMFLEYEHSWGRRE